MHPILFTLAGWPVHTYGAAYGAALFGGICGMVALGKRDGIDPSWMWDLGLLILFASVFGARAEYVRTHFASFHGDIAAMAALRDGGLVYYGGFVACALSIYAYARFRRVSPLRLLDHVAPVVPLGHALGRLGCFAAGCCYGRPTDLPWGVLFPPGGEAPSDVPRHPTQLYEAGGNVLIGLFLLWVWRRRSAPGQVFAALCLTYPVLRAIVETFRGDAVRGFVVGGLSNAQVTSAVLFVVGVLVLARRSKVGE